MYILGISGKMGTGKSTAAKEIKAFFSHMTAEDEAGNSREVVNIFSFGEAVKREVCEIYNIPYEWTQCPEGKLHLVDLTRVPEHLRPHKNALKLTVRHILQWYATEHTREKDPDYWVKKVIEQIKNTPGTHLAIIDDVRFPNEYDFCVRNGRCIRLKPYPGWNQQSDHISETALDDAHFAQVLSPSFGGISTEVFPTYLELIGIVGLSIIEKKEMN